MCIVDFVSKSIISIILISLVSACSSNQITLTRSDLMREERKEACEAPGEQVKARPTVQQKRNLRYVDAKVRRLAKRPAELCFSIDEEGKIIDESIFRIDRQGRAIYERRYSSLLKYWRFDPFRQDGLPVKQHAVRFSYDPDFDASPTPCTDENKITLPVKAKGKTVDPFWIPKKTSGRVELCMTVDSSGYVVGDTVKVLHSNLSRAFKWAAAETVKNWRFQIEDENSLKTDHVSVVYDYDNYYTADLKWKDGGKPDCELDAVAPVVRFEPVYPDHALRRSFRIYCLAVCSG